MFTPHDVFHHGNNLRFCRCHVAFFARIIAQTEKLKRRIFFIKRCLDNLNTKDFYRYCRFICVQFKYQNYSKFFDGDIEFLLQIFYKITKFIRDSLGKSQLTLRDIKADRLKEKRKKLAQLMKNITAYLNIK